MPADRFCDCATDDLVHAGNCARYDQAHRDLVPDVAAQVAAEDGYPQSRAAIRHPSHARTRSYIAAVGFPAQRSEGAR